jgi:predicted dehydrogenase
MVRLAIVGSGERAERHLAACRRVEGIEIVAMTGREYDEVLGRDDVDVVDVVAPPGPAVEIAVAAARAGKQVIAEYLPGTAAEDADRLTTACRDSGVPLRLLRPERWQLLAKELKATVEAGKLGSVRYAHAASIWHWPPAEAEVRREWSVPPPGDDPGQFLLEQATGTLDLVRWFFDVPVASVFARDCPLEGPEAPSWYVSVVLYFADASQAICEVGLTTGFAANTGLRRLALTGLRGSAYYNERDADLVIGAGGARPLVDDPVEGLTAAFADWAAAFGTETDDGSKDGRETLRLALAAAASLRTGEPVEVGE